MTREEYMTKMVTRCCEVCSRIDTDTLANLNKARWMWYSSEAGEYAIRPACEKVRAEKAAERRAKETKEDYRGFGYGT